MWSPVPERIGALTAPTPSSIAARSAVGEDLLQQALLREQAGPVVDGLLRGRRALVLLFRANSGAGSDGRRVSMFGGDTLDGAAACKPGSPGGSGGGEVPVSRVS